MKMTKKSTDGTPFVRKSDYSYDGVQYEADIKNGDIITIMNEGIIETGQYGEQNNFNIKTRNGEKKIGLNQKTINILIDEFGEESSDWVGKNVKVLINKTVIGGKKVDVVYLVTEGWQLDEYGDPIKGTPDDNTIQIEDLDEQLEQM